MITVAEDIRINVGSLLTFWNPLSHLGYWNDGSVFRRVTSFLAELLTAMDGPPLSASGRRSESHS
jgi:hypothetical protein